MGKVWLNIPNLIGFLKRNLIFAPRHSKPVTKDKKAMFLGVKFLFLVAVSPFVLWLVSYGITNKKSLIGKSILLFSSLVFFLLLGLIINSALSQKMILEKGDYYGEYIINRNYFKGKQADWQYEHFRFKISKNDSIYFYLTNKDKIIKTYTGKIETSNPYSHSERLILRMGGPSHHILSENPTTYRMPWHFILVFKSPKFNNMYFKKGKWKPIEVYN